MGRHEAADGAATHPLVADALHRRSGAAASGAHGESPLPGREGPIGWPGPDPDEGGEPVGWPGGLPGGRGAEENTASSAEQHQDAGVVRGWWRLLGRPRAA